MIAFLPFSPEEFAFSGLRKLKLAPAPPIVCCVIASDNLHPTGPSPYTCPGVDKPSKANSSVATGKNVDQNSLWILN